MTDRQINHNDLTNLLAQINDHFGFYYRRITLQLAGGMYYFECRQNGYIELWQCRLPYLLDRIVSPHSVATYKEMYLYLTGMLEGFSEQENQDNEKIEFTKLDNTINGNPRRACSYQSLLIEFDTTRGEKTTDELYAIALKRARQLGGKKYDYNKCPKGIVFGSGDERQLNKDIKALKNLSISQVKPDMSRPIHKQHTYIQLLEDSLKA